MPDRVSAHKSVFRRYPLLGCRGPTNARLERAGLREDILIFTVRLRVLVTRATAPFGISGRGVCVFLSTKKSRTEVLKIRRFLNQDIPWATVKPFRRTVVRDSFERRSHDIDD